MKIPVHVFIKTDDLFFLLKLGPYTLHTVLSPFTPAYPPILSSRSIVPHTPPQKKTQSAQLYEQNTT